MIDHLSRLVADLGLAAHVRRVLRRVGGREFATADAGLSQKG